MNGLVEFLTAAIAEDEAVAQRLLQDLRSQIEDEGHSADDRGPITESRMLGADIGAKYRGQSRWNNVARGQYVARLADPARVLAECESKRRIVETARREEYFSGGRSGLGRSLLLALALPYADRPGFREEWRA